MRSLLSAALLLGLAPFAHADVKLPSVFGSHMVLQRDKPIVVFGHADPGEKVSVALGDDKGTATAGPGGAWKVTLPARKASETGVTLTVTGDGSTITHTDVLVGDVWVGSGQSNMEWSLLASGSPKETIAGSSHPLIRLYHVPKVQSATPQRDIVASWRTCSPKTSPQFSAVLYHFGVALQKEIGVPIGLINSSWGGSRIEPWLATADPKTKQSGGMYNAMIAPISQFPVKGVIWYQGESNMAEGMLYRDKKATLIGDWRKFWGPDMPFYFVQIAPFTGYSGGSKLAELWEAQCACLKIPGTGMAATTDLVDDVKDIHPKNKLDVGNRLARWALNRTYGKSDVVVSGPLFRSLKIDGDKAVVSFAHAAGLKARDDKPLTEFEIAGEDGKFVAAEAKIDGETVIVSSKDVAKPVAVRFGWKNVVNPNLCNKEELPACPFRSTEWKGGTGELPVSKTE